MVSLHRRKRDGESGGGSVEDGRCGPWAEIQARITRGGPMKIMEVSKNGGSQNAQCAGKTVLWFESTACGV
ncbi:hypothetical protein DPMN_091123 [Dreissena polymorpha]|uniref:Uncharacterized protein n=1 Tax=Dreissena polymorpha TaxID=45954 RepID=A0A9D4QZP7_DREPO|nr:hypothetical protein DPMN_091123 [Dreissena polymorpha]